MASTEQATVSTSTAAAVVPGCVGACHCGASASASGTKATAPTPSCHSTVVHEE